MLVNWKVKSILIKLTQAFLVVNSNFMNYIIFYVTDELNLYNFINWIKFDQTEIWIFHNFTKILIY